MASVYNFNNAMDNWNLSQNPVAPTQGVLGSMAQSDTSAMPEIKEAAESNVPPMPTTSPTTQGATPTTPPPATVTPFGGKSSDVYKSGFDAAEERKNAWDLVKEDPQTTLIAFAMSMMANNDGTRNVSQLVGQAGLDALAAVQTREKVRYERAKEADKIGYDRFKDQRTHEMDVRKQDWSEKFQGDQMKRGWEQLGIQRDTANLANAKTRAELAQLALEQEEMRKFYGGSAGGYTVGNPNVTTGTQGGEGATGSLRYNNPLGLKGGDGGTEGYRVFNSIEEAYPAALSQLKKYVAAGAVTPRDLITGKVDPATGKHSDYAWSTASAGNPTDEYMKVLSQHGVNVDAPIDLNDPKQAATLLSAMGWMERGAAYGKEWTPERVLGALGGTPSKAGVPVVDNNGITPTNTTGAPRVGQQPTVPGMPAQQSTPRIPGALDEAALARAEAMAQSPSKNIREQGQKLIKGHQDAITAQARMVQAQASADKNKLEQQKRADAAVRQKEEWETKGLVVDQNVKKSLQLLGTGGWGVTGIDGKLMSMIPGSDRNDLESALETIKSNISLGQLQQLKQNSPNGASGLGALSDGEKRTLEAALASLDLNQSYEALKENLNTIHRLYRKMLTKAGYTDVDVDKLMPEIATGNSNTSTEDEMGSFWD